MSRRPVTVTFCVTAPRMGEVREWLREHDGKAHRDPEAALFDYVRCQLLSNSQWDGVPVTIRQAEGGAR